MKKLVFIILVGLLVIVALAVISCDVDSRISPTPRESEEITNSCLTCHSDEETLKEVASTKAEEDKSEATSGEG